MVIKQATPNAHAGLLGGIENNVYSQFLQVFPVVRSSTNLISRVMFVGGGLKAYLDACRDSSNPLYISRQAEASLCCGKLATAIGEIIDANNQQREAQGKNPIPYGLKVWVNGTLGVYITIGVQDLESFFERSGNVQPTS